MSATKYILTGAAGTTTHIDLGLQVGGLSFDGQSFEVKGSDGDNSFFLRPAGYSFDFTENGAGSDVIYLTGVRADYTVSPPDNGVVTLTRGAGETSETVRVSITAHDGSTPSNMTVVFSDGALRTDELQEAGGETLDETLKSVDFTLPSESTGGVRVGSVGVGDQSNVFGLKDQSFTAVGNGGVDQVFVAAGATVDATNLGVGEDRIYLEGNWADYTTKTHNGFELVLSRPVPNPRGPEDIIEEVKVIGGIGASNDLLLFADGSISTRAALLAVRDNPNVDITTNTEVWDSSTTSFSSIVELDGANNLTLSEDTGAAADDDNTSNGEMIVSGVTPGFAWQYSIDGGATWTLGSGSDYSFTLPGQVSGEGGVRYEAGQVQVRQVNPFGVASEAVSNVNQIIVDQIALEPNFDMRQFGLDVTNGRATTNVNIVGATGVTVQFWVKLDATDLAPGNDHQLAFGPTSAILRNGNIWLWNADSGAYVDSTVTASEGWNFISLTRDADSLDVVLVNDSASEGLTGTIERTAAADGQDEIRIGQNASDGAQLSAVIRDLRIWEGARDLATVRDDSAASLDGSETGLLGYWTLDAPTGNQENLVAAGPELTLAGEASLGGDAEGFPSGANQVFYTAGAPLISGGGAAPGAALEIFLGAEITPTGTATADANGNWQFQFTTPLPQAENSVRVEQTDLAGNMASSTASIIVIAALPAAPRLDDASNSADKDDNVTNINIPVLHGDLPEGTIDGMPVAIVIDDTTIVTGAANGASGGLEIAYGPGGVGGTWTYTHADSGQPVLEDGDRRIAVSVDGRVSEELIVTVDTQIDDPTITVQPPALIEAAALEDGVLTVRGGVNADVVSLIVTWDDDSSTTPDDPSTPAIIDADIGEWRASFDLASLGNMADGDMVTFSIVATDRAGNKSSVVTSNAVTLELENEAPQANPAVATVPPGFVALGTEGAAGGNLIIDVNDLYGDSMTDDAMFIDPDAEGSANGTLAYSAVVVEGEPGSETTSPLPSWLAITEDGKLFHVEGETPSAFETMKLRITAEDGGNATATRDITLGGLGVSDLRAPLDTGQSDSDDVTKALRPEVEVRVPDALVPNGTLYQVFLNDDLTAVESLERGQPPAGNLTISSDGTGTFTFPEDLPEGPTTVYFKIGEIQTAPVTIFVDRTINDPVIADAPTLIEASTFVDGAFEITGTADIDVYKVTLAWDDGDPTTMNDPTFDALVHEDGTWTAIITETEMALMSDTLTASFTVTAEDIAGNDATTGSGDVVLEFVNQAPTLAPDLVFPPGAFIVALPGTVGEVGGTKLFDLLDFNDDGVRDDPMFVDGDAPGSLNGTLTYRIEKVGVDTTPPDWLEVTDDGIIQIKEGATVSGPDATLRIIATDGAEAFADHTVALSVAEPSSLSSPISGETEIDVRSAIVLDAPKNENASFTFVDGTYEIRLVEKTGVPGKEGFRSEMANGNQTITVTVTDGVASVDGGAVRFENNKIVIDFDHDLDLASNYDIEVDAGLFLDGFAGLPTLGVGPGEINFSTVSPVDGAGQLAKTWDPAQDAFVEDATWFDGAGGNYLDNEAGLSADLSDVKAVVVLGRDTDSSEQIVLDNNGRTVLTGFGADDHLYIDQDIPRDMLHAENIVDESTIAFGNNDGTVPTHLLFSSTETAAGVLITFENRDDTPPEVDESEQIAIAFSIAALEDDTSGDRSFEHITGNATPVLSG